MAREFELRTVAFKGGEICYRLERKRVKNLNLRVGPEGVFASASSEIEAAEVDGFVASKGDYILAALREFESYALRTPSPKRYVSGESFTILGRRVRLRVQQGASKAATAIAYDGVFLTVTVADPDDYGTKRLLVTDYFERLCRETYNEIVAEKYPLVRKYGAPRPTVRIREMETRWGSCSAKTGVITFNKRLIAAPRFCVEYVAIHELCHLIYPNHSKDFYALLTTFVPDWQERRKILNELSPFRL